MDKTKSGLFGWYLGGAVDLLIVVVDGKREKGAMKDDILSMRSTGEETNKDDDDAHRHHRYQLPATSQQLPASSQQTTDLSDSISTDRFKIEQ
jgi:hypothetical protein